MIPVNTILNGRYHIDQKIGQGGFAEVFLCTDQSLRRKVAVKVLNAELTEDGTFLARFEREAQSIAGLEHPNILGVYDYGQANNTAYLVMPFIEGGTLHDRLRRDKTLSLQETNYYLQQAAAALDFAHRRNIVHRDIKPQNMLLRTDDNRLLLADFGIAKVLDNPGAQSRTGVLGTIAYMAPEQFEGTIHFATDVYALGCVLFQMLTGKLPYTGSTEQVMAGHLVRQIPSVVELSGGTVPAVVQGVIDRALAKKAEERFQTGGQLAQAFQAVISGITYTGPTQPVTDIRTIISPTVPNLPVYSTEQGATRLSTPVTPYPTAKRSISPLVAGLAGFIVVALIGLIALLVIKPGSVSNSTTLGTVITPTTAPSVSATIQKSVGTVSATSGVLLPSSGTSVSTTPAEVNPAANGLKAANDAFFVKGDISGGIKMFTALTQTYPSNAKVWRDFGNALHLSSRDAGGVEPIEKARSLDPKDPLTLLYLEFAYFDNYRFDDAQKIATNAAQVDPIGWFGHAAMASFYSYTFKIDQAKTELDLMQKAASNVENDPYYNWVLSNNLSFQEDYAGAVAAINKTLEVWPNFPTAIALKGSYVLDMPGDTKANQAKGLELIQQSLKVLPDSSIFLSQLAEYYAFYANDYTNAEKFAQQALKSYASNPSAHEVLGQVLVSKKDYPNAYKEFDKCIQVNKYGAGCQVYWSLGLITQSFDLSGEEKTKAQKAALDKALELNGLLPKNSNVNWLVGYVYYNMGDYNNSTPSFQKATAAAPNNANFFAWLGLSYVGQGNTEKAQGEYNKGVAIDPENANIKFLGEKINAK